MKLKNEIEKNLSPIVKEAFNGIGRVGNMVWISFGDVVEITTRGKKREVSRYALHIQCSWRLSLKDDIVVASCDFYYPSQSWFNTNGFKHNDLWENNFTWDEYGNNRFDEKSKILSEYAKTHTLIVDKIKSDDLGGFKLYFSDEHILEVFPDSSLPREFWRFLIQGNNDKHYIVFDKE